jgi:cytochrome c oxidase subunit 2
VRELRWELGWTLIPLGLFLAVFLGSEHLYFTLYSPPAGAMPVYVIGKQYPLLYLVART